MAKKIKVFAKAKKPSKDISQLNPEHQKLAVSYLKDLELQAEQYISDFRSCEKICECCEKNILI